MQIKDSKFHKVWKVELDQNGRKKVNLGDSKKNQDGSFNNWTWFFCNLVGNAKGVHIDEGDTITIKNGKIEMYKTQSGEYKNSITIFDIEVTAKGNQQNSGYSNNNNYPTGNNQGYNNGVGRQNDYGNYENNIPH